MQISYIKVKEKIMKTKPIAIFLSITLSFLLVSCADTKKESFADSPEPCAHILTKTEDYGEEYLDGFVFFGESTTYHLKSRGVLRGGTKTDQVWAPKCGTVNLDFTTRDIKIVYPETNEEMTVAQAAALKKPKYIVFTFGLNGAVQKVSRGEEYFKKIYGNLISSVKEASPETLVILQSAFPVSRDMDTAKYTVDALTLNAYIDKINGWTSELAANEGLKYLNTAEILKAADGTLDKRYDAGDGHHLSKLAYTEILSYIRTHGYK